MAAGVSTLAVVVLLIGAAVGAGRLIAGSPEVDGYLSSREADGAHVLMNLGMAWMASPWFGPSGRAVLLGGFALLAVVCAARLVLARVRPSAVRPGRCGADVYHLVAAVAMVLAAGMSADGMTSTDMAPVAGPPWYAVLLAVGFGVDALLTLAVAVLAPERVAAEGARRSGAVLAADPSVRRTVRVAAVPHVVVGAGMTAMLLMLRVPQKW